MNGYGDSDRKKTWSSCGSTYCTCLKWRVIRTLRRPTLDPTDKPDHTEASVLCKVIRIVITIFMKLVRVFLTYQCLYIMEMLNRCRVQVSTLEKQHSSPRFNVHLEINKCIPTSSHSLKLLSPLSVEPFNCEYWCFGYTNVI
jgi:hypothetical protein